MAFPILVDVDGNSQPGGTIPSGQVFFYNGVAYVFATHFDVSPQVVAYSSPDGVTWSLADYAHHPAGYDGLRVMVAVQDTNVSNLFYVIYPGNDDIWHITTFDASVNLWSGTIYDLSNPAQGGPAECINLSYGCFRSVDSLVLFSVMGDNSLVDSSRVLAQICAIDPSTGAQSAWVTLPYVPPVDLGSDWETSAIGMAEGAAGVVHIVINRPTGIGDGSDFTRSYQTTLLAGGGFGPLTEIPELKSPEQAGLSVILIDDLKSDGAVVYMARADRTAVYSEASGELIVGGGTSAPGGVAFSFEAITPDGGTPQFAGMAIVPPGVNLDFGLIFTDDNGLEFWEAPGPGAFVLFSTDTPDFQSAFADIGTVLFGPSSILGPVATVAQGIRANGPVFRTTPLGGKRKMFPRYIKRFNEVGN